MVSFRERFYISAIDILNFTLFNKIIFYNYSVVCISALPARQMYDEGNAVIDIKVDFREIFCFSGIYILNFTILNKLILYFFSLVSIFVLLARQTLANLVSLLYISFNGISIVY